ncbi:unnamed protein product [Ectocarpus sp. 12 AP-2014]
MWLFSCVGGAIVDFLGSLELGLRLFGCVGVRQKNLRGDGKRGWHHGIFLSSFRGCLPRKRKQYLGVYGSAQQSRCCIEARGPAHLHLQAISVCVCRTFIRTPHARPGLTC